LRTEVSARIVTDAPFALALVAVVVPRRRAGRRGGGRRGSAVGQHERAFLAASRERRKRGSEKERRRERARVPLDAAASADTRGDETRRTPLHRFFARSSAATRR